MRQPQGRKKSPSNAVSSAMRGSPPTNRPPMPSWMSCAQRGALACSKRTASADRARPELASLLRNMAAGETLVVVRPDRLARSVSHLLAVIEQLEARGAHFRSLRDPIDTTTPQGMFPLQVLGAVAQLERALIAERTKAGLKDARTRGRVGGNPGLRAGDSAPSASWAQVATPRILTLSWPGWTPGCRPCSGCDRTSHGATSCAS